MVRITLQLIVAISLTGLAGCGSDKQKSEALEKANQTHTEAMAIAKKIEERLASVRKAAQDSATIKTVDSLANLLELWEEGLVEVPGFEHEHPHDGHGHEEHEHKPAPNMTDESMLEFQTTAKGAIQLIESEVNKQFK